MRTTWCVVGWSERGATYRVLVKGLVAGIVWGWLALLLGNLWSLGVTWGLCSGAITGVVVASLLLIVRTIRGAGRIALAVPVLFLGQALFTLVLTLPVTCEGAWPERWLELMLAAY